MGMIRDCFMVGGSTVLIGGLIIGGIAINERTSLYKGRTGFIEKPKNSLEQYVNNYKNNTYIDELETINKTSTLVKEMYTLDESIQIVDLLKKLDLKKYSEYIPLKEEEINELKLLTYDEITILKEEYDKAKSKTYEEQKTKELLGRSLAYLLLTREDYVNNNGQRIALEFGTILLQSSVAEALECDAVEYDEFKVSFDKNVVDYQDEILGAMAIKLKQNSTYNRIGRYLKELKEGTTDYETLKIIVDYYKYAVISNPVYENSTIKDEQSWLNLHKEMQK